MGAGLSGALGETAGGSEYLSFQGSTSYVYSAYSGCGRRTQFSLGDALELSYSTASGTDPFERFTGRTRDEESFFDAEIDSDIGELGRIGYAASLYSAVAEGEALGDRVTGSRLWFSSADRRLKVSSEMAVSASEAKGQVGTAQRHQISMVVLDSASSNLSTSLSFSSVDQGFAGRRSVATPDRQVVGAVANLTAGNAGLLLRFRNANDNVDRDRNRVTHVWRTVDAEGSYRLGRGPVLPDRVRLYANRTERHEFDWNPEDLDGPAESSETVGLAMTWWTDWLDRSPARGDGAVAFSADLFADWRAIENAAPVNGLATGVNARFSLDLERLLSVPGHVRTATRMAGGEHLDDGFGWHWNLSAEVDCLALLLDTPSSPAAYLFGRFGSGVGEQAAGLIVDYRGMLAAGIRF